MRVQWVPMLYLKWTFILVAVGYLAVGTLMYFAQRTLMYFPEAVRTAPAVQPTEDGLIGDARAAYAFANARYPAARIVLWGESLGTGVAVALAAEKPVSRLILESPYTSTVDVAAAQYWFLPVRFLMKDQFRSDLRIARVTAPVLIMHGDADGVIPITFGQRLFAMIPGKKRMVRFPGGGHNDLDAFGASGVAIKFIEER